MKPFVKPTLEEVRAYCQERKNGIDPELWYAHYESNGWMVGRVKMKNWRMAVITWEKMERRFSKRNGRVTEDMTQPVKKLLRDNPPAAPSADEMARLRGKK